MQLGIHAMAWTPHWSNESLPLIDRVAALGLDFIEIPLMGIEDIDPGSIRSQVEGAGIGVVTSSVLSDSTDITSADASIREAGVAYLQRCVDATAEMGAPQFSGVIYCSHGKRPSERPGADEWEWSAECLTRVAAHAQEAGIVIGLEPVNRYESPLLNTCEQALQLADMITLPNVKVHLDTYHMNIEEKGFHDPIVAAGPRMQYIHLSESDRGIPGTGNVHWDDVFRGLKDAGYSGRLVMESFAAVNEDIIGATAMWRDVVGDPHRLVTEGLAFLREKAAAFGIMDGGPAEATDGP